MFAIILLHMSKKNDKNGRPLRAELQRVSNYSLKLEIDKRFHLARHGLENEKYT